MAKRTKEDYRKLIQSALDEWSWYLGVAQQWDITLKIVDKGRLENPDSAGECTWPSFYRNASIKINANWLSNSQPEDSAVETCVVHELCHLVYAESWDNICEMFGRGHVRESLLNQEERNVDILVRFLMRSKYADTSDRPCELDGSTEPDAVEPAEGLRPEPDDSGFIVWNGSQSSNQRGFSGGASGRSVPVCRVRRY